MAEPTTYTSYVDAQKDAEGASFVGGIADAISNEWVAPVLWRRWRETQFEPDGFVATPEQIVAVPAPYRDAVARANSKAEYEYISSKINNAISRQENLQKLGWKGVALTFAAAGSDPIGWFLGGGTGAIVANTAKGARLTKLAKAGVFAAGENALLESALVAADENRSPVDILLAAGFGAGFGLGGATLGMRRQASLDDLDIHEALESGQIARDIEDVGEFLTEAGIEYEQDLKAAKEAARISDIRGDDDVPGIRPESDNLYERLDISENATPKDIDKAYMSAKKAIGDSGDGTLARVGVARDILKDARLRGIYTRQGLDAAVTALSKEAAGRARRARSSAGFIEVPDVKIDFERISKNVYNAALKGVEPLRTLALAMEKFLGERSATFKSFAEKVRLIFGDLFEQADLVKSWRFNKSRDKITRPEDEVAEQNLAGELEELDEVDEERNFTRTERHWQAFKNKAMPALSGLRYDTTASLKRNVSKLARAWGHTVFEEPVGNADHSKTFFSSSQNYIKLRRVFLYRHLRRMQEVKEALLEHEGGLFGFKDEAEWNKFDREVMPVARGATPPTDLHKLAAEKYQETFAELLNDMKKAGVPGWEFIPENANYIPRIISASQLRKLNADYGPDKIIALLKKSFKEGDKDMSDELAEKLAKGYYKTIMDAKVKKNPVHSANFWDNLDAVSEAEIEKVLGPHMSLSELDEIKLYLKHPQQVLGDALDSQGVSDRAIEATTEYIENKQAKQAARKASKGASPRARRRARLNELTELPLEDKNGVTRPVSISELYEGSTEAVTRRYIRDAAGDIAWNEMIVSTARMYDVDPQDVDIEWIERKVRDEIGGTMSEKYVNSTVNKLKLAHEYFKGIPHGNYPELAKFLSMVRKMNFSIFMNQMGVAQIAELGPVLGTLGVKQTMQNIPAFKEIHRMVQTGEAPEGLLDEIVAATGIGTEPYLRHFVENFEDHKPTSKAGQGVDKMLDKANIITAQISTANHINTGLKLMSLGGAVQNLANAVAKAGDDIDVDMVIDIIGEKRVAQMGLDDVDVRAIAEQIQLHAKKAPLGENHEVATLGLDDWDTHIRDLFVETVMSTVNRAVQENDPGMMMPWMSDPIGGAIMQFRSFVNGAYTKQFLAGLHVRDKKVVMSWLLSMFITPLGYIGQTALNGLGRKDREDYYAKRLSAKAIGLAAFQRASFASILPGVIDTGLRTGGFDPLFAYGRSSGQATSFIAGNPTVSLINGLSQLPGTVLAPATNGSSRQFSRSDAKDIQRLIVFQNAFLVKNLLDYFATRLPKNSVVRNDEDE